MENKHVEIAQRKIKELGIDVNKMQCRDKTSEWKMFLHKRNDSGEFSEVYQKLISTDFIVIYCCPTEADILGGDINVFIDRNTDEIIDVLRGQ